MSSVPARVLLTLRDHCLVRAEDRIAVGISGGADSVALLWILRELEGDRRLGGSLAGLIHVNHGLRGAESRRDEEFCRGLAERLCLPIEIGHFDVAAAARESGRSLEATGRDVRYRFFSDAAARLDATLVATGHTVDDQAETVLLRLLRGAGARGVGGIRVRRGAVIRPLLHVRRADLRAYLAERQEPFCEDASNDDRSFARNRVRHDLLPVIEQIAPGGPAALARFAGLSVADEAYLHGAATEAAAAIVLSDSARGPREESESGLRQGYGQAPSAQVFDGAFESGGVQLDAGALARLPLAIGRRVVRLLIEQAAPGLGFSSRHIDAVLGLAKSGSAAGHLDLAHLQVERRGQRLWFGTQTREAPARFSRQLPLPGVVEVPEAGMTIAASFRGTADSSPLSSGLGDVATVQGAIGPGPWVVRSRQPGDRLQPLGAPGHRKLHDLLIDRKIPRDARDRVPIVVDAAGRIVWVVGVTIAHEYRVTTPQTGVVVLEVRRNAG